MSTEERVFTTKPKYQFRFQSSSLAPVKGGSGKARFSVEPMVNIPGGGWDIVDFHVKGNEFAVGFYKYVRSKELMGYEHTGDSSKKIKATIEKIWGEPIE